MTNTSWHSPLAIDSTPSHGVPSAMPTHQQNSNIFLNKACPDARARGNLVYVDDVLMKAQVCKTTSRDQSRPKPADNSRSQDRPSQRTGCKTKVNYVGLLVGRNGIEPQSNRTQAIQSIKTPTNISELRSFLGVCNYSRQFIENYAGHCTTTNFPPEKDEPSFGRKHRTQQWASSNSACALLRALPIQTQEKNSI